MEFKTIQWNIGGAKAMRIGSDAALLASYTEDYLDEIIKFLRQQDADIITLQETHASSAYSQPQIIADTLGYAGWVNDELADSHIEPGQRLGQAIIAKKPLANHSFDLFTNPHFQAVWEDGTTATSHDKGRTKCTITLDNGQEICMQTVHLIPFRRFNVAINSPEVTQVLHDVEMQLRGSETGIIQGDFNIDEPSLKLIFPQLFIDGFDEIVQVKPTTPKDRRLDHIVYKGLEVINSTVDSSVSTDHFPIITTFKLASDKL